MIYIYIHIDERTQLNSSPLNHEKKSKKSSRSFSELPDDPDFAVLRTTKVRMRNTTSVFSRCDSSSQRLALLIQHLFNDDSDTETTNVRSSLTNGSMSSIAVPGVELSTLTHIHLYISYTHHLYIYIYVYVYISFSLSLSI